MKEGERRILEANKKKRGRSCSVGKRKNTSPSASCHSFTNENEVSSPSPKQKMTGGRKDKGKGIAAVSRGNEFVPPAIHLSIPVQSLSGSPHIHGDVPPTFTPDQIPSSTSRASGDCTSPNIPESPASGAHHSSIRGPDTTQRIFIRPRAQNKFDRQLEN